MNRSYLILGAIISLFLIAGVISVNNHSREDRPAKETFRTNFMDGCSPDGANYRYCSCAADYLLNNYTSEYLVTLSLKYEEDPVKNLSTYPEMVKAITACMSYYQP